MTSFQWWWCCFPAVVHDNNDWSFAITMCDTIRVVVMHSFWSQHCIILAKSSIVDVDSVFPCVIAVSWYYIDVVSYCKVVVVII